MRRGSHAARAAALVVLTGVVYLNALNNPFVYDDVDTVTRNPSLTDVSNVRYVLLYSLYRPVVNVSYAIDRAVWGFTPFGFHLTNVALHAIVVVLFYLLAVRAFRDRCGDREPPRDWPAFAAAALYAVHPMMTEAAGYVSGRSEVLCTAAFLAALVAARRAIVSGSVPFGAVATLFGVIAVASKESAAALPVVVLAYDAWVLSRETGAWKRRWWRVYLPVFVVMAAAAAVRLHTLLAAEAQLRRGPVENLMTQAIVIWRYVRLLVWPAGQTIMHAVRFVSSAADPRALVAALGSIAVIVVAFRLRKRAPLTAVGVVWFFAALAPSSSIVALREGMAEHRVYLAAGGFFLALAALLRAAPAAWSRTLRVAAAVAVVGCALLTVRRTVVWSSAATLWAESASRAPAMWEPHYALADALREARDCERAIPEYQTVVRLMPAHRDAELNLGICLAETGRPAQAEAAFTRAAAIDPSSPRPYTNLGALAILEGQPERARDAYLAALRIDRQNVLARMQLAALYEHAFHDYRAAAQLCGEARAIAPFTPGVADCAERNWRLAAQSKQ